MRFRLLAAGFSVLFLLFGCSTPQKTTDVKSMSMEDMIRGKDVNLYWLDRFSEFTDYKSIQLPDFADKHYKTELAWVNASIPERISTWLSTWKLGGIIDRTPRESMPWTDLVLRGGITDIQLNPDIRSQIAVECSLYDVRKRKEVCIIRHQRFIYQEAYGTSNPLETLSQQIADDIARFLKDVFEQRITATDGES